MITKNIIDILLEKKIITNAQALECQAHAEETGQSVRACLLKKSMSASEDLAKATAQSGWACPM